MSRRVPTTPRRNPSVWDRPATDTRLLPNSHPSTVPLSPLVLPNGLYTKSSAPSRHLLHGIVSSLRASSQLFRAVDACVNPQMNSRSASLGVDADACPGSPQMNTHGAYPLRAHPVAVDARANPRMISRSALIGVDADACVHSWMIPGSAVPGIETDACVNPQMIPHAPATDAAAPAAEGALATLPIPSPSAFNIKKESAQTPIPSTPFPTTKYAIPLRSGLGSNTCCIESPPLTERATGFLSLL